MRFFQKILLISVFFKFGFLSNVGAVPESFADLAEELMPSVVYISTTQTVKTTGRQFPFEFPPGSPFGEMFKDFERDRQTERQINREKD